MATSLCYILLDMGQHEDYISEFVTFDRRIVEAKMADMNELDVEDLIAELLPHASYISIVGWNDVVIAWIPQGTMFRIDEYDGNESIRIFDTSDYYST